MRRSFLDSSRSDIRAVLLLRRPCYQLTMYCCTSNYDAVFLCSSVTSVTDAASLFRQILFTALAAPQSVFIQLKRLKAKMDDSNELRSTAVLKAATRPPAATRRHFRGGGAGASITIPLPHQWRNGRVAKYSKGGFFFSPAPQPRQSETFINSRRSIAERSITAPRGARERSLATTDRI